MALFLKLCELYDDRIAVIDMNDRRKGCKDEAVEAVAVSKRRVDEAVEKLRKAILERRTNPTMFRSPDTSISTDTDHSQSMEAQEDNPPLVLVWKSILRELGVGGKTGACDEISRKLACMTTREENQEDAFIDARLVLEARQALMASLVVTGEKPEVKSLTASFANLTRKQTVHVPVRELWPLLVLAESVGCTHIAEEVIARIQWIVGCRNPDGCPAQTPGQDFEAVLYELWSSNEKNKAIKASAEALLTSYQPNEQVAPGALRAVEMLTAKDIRPALQPNVVDTLRGEGDVTDDEENSDVGANTVRLLESPDERGHEEDTNMHFVDYNSDTSSDDGRHWAISQVLGRESLLSLGERR